MTTLRAGLIGAHISRTRLPAALEIMCADAGLSLEFELIDTGDDPEFDFEETVEQLMLDGWTGVSVTHPWKTQARRFAGGAMATTTQHLGACNTLIFGAQVKGDNTDYSGFCTVIAPLGPLGDVVVMGAGGVAEATVPALRAQQMSGAHVGLFDLDVAKAQALADRCGAGVVVLGEKDLKHAVENAQGLINCTPLGMAEYPGSAFCDHVLTNSPPKWAFDAVYTPVETPFLRAAADAGLSILTGFDLFRAMAVHSFEAYTGLTVDQAAVMPRLNALRPEPSGA